MRRRTAAIGKTMGRFGKAGSGRLLPTGRGLRTGAYDPLQTFVLRGSGHTHCTYRPFAFREWRIEFPTVAVRVRAGPAASCR
jgi:hypothetical protein